MSMICRDELQSIKDSIECCLLPQVRKGDVDIDALETWCKAVVKRINAALAAPRRNCDIGTSNEHMRRFRLFCQAHQSPMSGMCDPICPLCGNPTKSHCITEWMLMPYSEGDVK